MSKSLYEPAFTKILSFVLSSVNIMSPAVLLLIQTALTATVVGVPTAAYAPEIDPLASVLISSKKALATISFRHFYLLFSCLFFFFMVFYHKFDHMAFNIEEKIVNGSKRHIIIHLDHCFFTFTFKLLSSCLFKHVLLYWSDNEISYCTCVTGFG